MVLDEGAQAEELFRSGIARDYGVRVSDRDRRELQLVPLTSSSSVGATSTGPMSISTSRPPRIARVHLTLADGDRDLAGARSPGKPAGGDPRPVARELGGRAVRVPDDDLGARPLGGERPRGSRPSRCRSGSRRAGARGRFERSAELLPLYEQVVVAEPVPFRESQGADSVTKRLVLTPPCRARGCRPRRLRASARRRRPRFPGSGASTCAGRPRTAAFAGRSRRSHLRGAARRPRAGR